MFRILSPNKISSIKSFSLTQAISKDFTVFTNESLKKAFDEKLKEKYIPKNEENNNINQEQLFDQMKDIFEEAIEEQENEESILKAYKQQVFTAQLNPKEQQEKIEQAKFVKESEKYFQGISTDQFLKRSKNLVESIRLEKSWKPVHQTNISDEYLDYDKYRRNYAKLKNIEKTDKQATQEFALGRNIVDFIRTLDDKVTDKNILMDYIKNVREEVTAKDYDPEKVEEMVDHAYDLAGSGPPSKESDEPEKMEINLGEFEDRKVKDHVIYGRVSPHAKEEIYRLHKEGWSLRDLSIRFGLLPERVKFILWAKQYFYDEVMPNVSATTVRLGLEREMMYNINFPWVDYGLDLEDLAERERGVYFTRYRWTELDANPPKEVAEKMDRVLDKQTKKKWEMVTEQFVGSGNKGYYVKSWIVNKGHGSERVNKKFKGIIQQSAKNPQLLPDKVRYRIKEGPRAATRGYGIK